MESRASLQSVRSTAEFLPSHGPLEIETVASFPHGPRQIRKGECFVSTVRYSNEELRKRRAQLAPAKHPEATEEQIATWKREDGFADEDVILGPGRLVPALTDVRALRDRLGLSQEAFSERYMLSLRTVQEWEQRRREPSEAARVLLYAIVQDPDAIARILHPNAA